MRIRKLAWQFFLVCFVIISVTIWITTWYSARVYNQLYLENTVNDVSRFAYLIQRQLTDYISDPDRHGSLDSLCKTIGHSISVRITVVLPSGKVIGDSQRNPDSMENHGNRPEILKAFSGGRGVQQRFSTSMQDEMLYVAFPIFTSNKTAVAALRMSVSINAIKKQERQFYLRVVFASLIIFALLLLVSYLLSKHLSKLISQITEGAKRFASGDLNFRLPVAHGEELGVLASSLNRMASTLDDRIVTITRQHNQSKAILNSMTEGVIAIDAQEKIISINPAAASLFSVPDGSVSDKWLHEIIRNSTLQRFTTHVLSSDTIVETTFILHTPNGNLNVNASGTILNNEKSGPEGAVLVFNDITRLKKLENIRKEFVANVSHELRTPLTSIKGFVETIQTGNYQLPGEVSEFLNIISSKTDRLCRIVDDLLSLSSIERDYEHHEISFINSELKTVLEDAIKTCTGKANEKNTRILLSMEQPVQVVMNTSLIEQAIVNLIDNAIKYSNEGSDIVISANKSDQKIIISVSDQGIGIPREHLDRIFERFYRVDKARSRKLGGTGLGLSIVKNIVATHNGQVFAESEPGKGSTFKIILPEKQAFQG